MSSHLSIHNVKQGTHPLSGPVLCGDKGLSVSLCFIERRSASDFPTRHTVTVFLDDLDAAFDVAEWLERTSRELHRVVSRERGLVTGEFVPPGEAGGDASGFPTSNTGGA
jgi:hypothetical protein